jgi:hypothetical protein
MIVSTDKSWGDIGDGRTKQSKRMHYARLVGTQVARRADKEDQAAARRGWGLYQLFFYRVCDLRYSPALAMILSFPGMAANKVTAVHQGYRTSRAKPDTKAVEANGVGGFFPRAAQQPGSGVSG